MIDANDVESGQYSYNIKNARNVMFAWGAQTNTEMYDVFIWWASYADHLYGVQGTWSSEHTYLCNVWVNNFNVYYSMGLESCSYCLGCIRLQNKSYCILNKQYTKEAWHEKVDEIFGAMEEEWTLWAFFPAWMNPFYFNDTAASLIEDYTKEEIIEEWFLWRDEEVKVDVPEWVAVVQWSELCEYEWWSESPLAPLWERGESKSSISSSSPSLPKKGLGDDLAWTISPDILKKVIQDEEWNVYRIIPMEFKFLKKYGLPLPRKHWLERLKQHFIVKE
jgi:hypothetical protein